jgi:hypothetical protein
LENLAVYSPEVAGCDIRMTRGLARGLFGRAGRASRSGFG